MIKLFLRTFVLMSAFLLPMIPLAAHADASQRLVQMLDYIGVDYPPTVENGVVVDDVEYTEMQEFSNELENFLNTMPDNPNKASLLVMVAQIQQGVSEKVPGAEISSLTQKLKADLIESYQIVVGPARVPDMSHVQALYETDCSSCHGLLGYGDGPLASSLEIPPSNFHEMDRQYSRSVYDLYNTITLGVSGTPMPAFAQLNDEQRWALAFMVSQYSGKKEQREEGKLLWQQGQLHKFFHSLSNLTGTSYAKANELGEHAGVDGQAILVYLRSNPKLLEVSDNVAIDTSIAMLATSLKYARAGDSMAAHKSALSAYLDGFELVEPSLVVVDRQLKKAIEKEMILFRELSKTNRVDELEVLQEKLVDLLSQAKETISSTQMSPAAAFAGSFIILLREGVEAILVLAAIMTALVKTGRREAMKYIHIGWVSAIVLGVATWWVAENLIAISGADRETTEGFAALFAAAILLYVGFWLHNASHSERWKKYIEHKIDNAMENRTLWVLGTVAFIAVYREMFETVLFYQAMWMQIDNAETEQGFLLGILAAIGFLLVIAFVIMRVGARLPIKQFFQIVLTGRYFCRPGYFRFAGSRCGCYHYS